MTDIESTGKVGERERIEEIGRYLITLKRRT